MSALELCAIAAGAGLLAVAVPAGLGWMVWRRPSLFRAVLAGTLMSLFVVLPWSFMASLTIGPAGSAGPDGFSLRGLRGWYVRLAAGPTGNPAELAVVVIGLVVAYCLLAAWRSRRPAGEAVAEDPAGPADGGAGDDRPFSWPRAEAGGLSGPQPAWMPPRRVR